MTLVHFTRTKPGTSFLLGTTALALTTAAVAGVAMRAVGSYADGSVRHAAEPCVYKALAGRDHAAGVASLQETSKAFAHVTKKVSPAVVFISVEKQLNPSAPLRDVRAPEFFDEEWLKKFFGDRWQRFEMPKPHAPRQFVPAVGHGSGFVISEDGYTLTNAHVVRGASKVTVKLADGREFEAKIIGTDSRSDVAVIKIEASNLPVLHMGNSDEIEVGEWVLAVGSPFGLPGTVTSGIVSAKGRSRVGIADYENFIQTDAAINPGNSGGPLVNLSGEVVGINTAIFSRTGAYNGIGFAIPINMVRDICDQLIAEGSVTRGYLGVTIQELTPALAKAFGLEMSEGALISEVAKGSPAESSGLKPGDVIVEFNGKTVKDTGALRNMVAATQPESKVDLLVMHDAKPQTHSVTVGKLPAAAEHPDPDTDPRGVFGLTVEPLSKALREKFGYETESGVVVARVQPGSQAARAGLQRGMLITEVNRHKVQDVKEFHELVGSCKGDTLLLRVQKGDHSRYVTLNR